MRSSPAAERRLRRQHVVALRAAGCTYAAIAAQTGLSRTGVFNICKRVVSAGTTALDGAPNPRRRSQLDDAQTAMLRTSITENTPDRLSLPPLLWTPALVTQWVEQCTGVRLSVRNTALKLRQWGFGPPQPLAKARLHDAPAVARWLKDSYPAIVLRARAEGAELGWLGVSPLQPPAATGSALSRAAAALQPPRSVFSTVDNRGRMRWATFPGSLGAALFVELLRRRIRGADRKIVLIQAPLPVHRACQVRQWLAEHEDSIELVLLPHPPGAAPSG